MLKLNTVFLGTILAAMGIGLTAPATAQFEVAPDHFADNTSEQAQGQTSKHEPALDTRIRELQSELDGYQWQIKQRASAVEAARRLANGAGGEGEFAPLFIDEYVQRYCELEQLKQTLAPLIRLAQTTLSQLTSGLAATVPEKHNPTVQKKQKKPPVLVAESRAKQQRQLAALAHR
jgi:hypothetical protein